MLNFCEFIQVYVFSTNHHLKSCSPLCLVLYTFYILLLLLFTYCKPKCNKGFGFALDIMVHLRLSMV